MMEREDGREARQGERRQNSLVRDVFDSAYAIIEPFFDPAAGWGSRSLQHLAFRVLRDNFPEFSVSDVHAVVAAAHRVYIHRNPLGSDHLRRPDELKYCA